MGTQYHGSPMSFWLQLLITTLHYIIDYSIDSYLLIMHPWSLSSRGTNTTSEASRLPVVWSGERPEEGSLLWLWLVSVNYCHPPSITLCIIMLMVADDYSKFWEIHEKSMRKLGTKASELSAKAAQLTGSGPQFCCGLGNLLLQCTSNLRGDVLPVLLQVSLGSVTATPKKRIKWIQVPQAPASLVRSMPPLKSKHLKLRQSERPLQNIQWTFRVCSWCYYSLAIDSNFFQLRIMYVLLYTYNTDPHDMSVSLCPFHLASAASARRMAASAASRKPATAASYAGNIWKSHPKLKDAERTYHVLKFKFFWKESTLNLIYIKMS